MLTKQKFIDSITVDVGGILSVREVITVADNGQEIARTYHRTTLAPGSALDGQDSQVVAIANAAWTPEVIEAYQQNLAAFTPE